MNEMHENEFKSFSKTLEFSPKLPKQECNTFYPQKSINGHILYQHLETYNLGWPNQIHT